MKYEADDPRRRTLIQMLAAGMFGGVTTASTDLLAQILGSPPSKLPPGKSVYRISGEVQIDGSRGTLESKIAGGPEYSTNACLRKTSNSRSPDESSRRASIVSLASQCSASSNVPHR